MLPDKSRIPLLDSKGETLVSFHHIEDSAWSNLVNRYMVAICKDKLITIGRLEESSICLREGSTSRRHCSICLNSKGQVVIKDN